MNKLKGSRAYLCGAMDRVKDGGVGWRKMLRCAMNDLRIQWLDPTRKPIDIGLEDEASRARRRANKLVGNFEAVAAEMKQIRRIDLHMVDICDWMPVNLDLEVHACGTHEEIGWANRCKKPVLVHVEQGKAEAPDWLFGMLPPWHIFSTWEELVLFVRRISSGEIVDPSGRWYFFDWMGDNPVIQQEECA